MMCDERRLRMLTTSAIFSVIGLAGAGEAHAYVGPGLGAGTLAVVLGILGSALLALFAVIWYPLKRVMRRRRATGADRSATDGSPR